VFRCRGTNKALAAIIGDADRPDSRIAELILEIKGIPCPPLPRFLAQAVSDVTWQINDFRRCPRPAAPGRIRIFRRENFPQLFIWPLNFPRRFTARRAKVSATVSVLRLIVPFRTHARTYARTRKLRGHTYDTYRNAHLTAPCSSMYEPRMYVRTYVHSPVSRPLLRSRSRYSH